MLLLLRQKKKIKGNKHKNKSIHLVPNSRRATKYIYIYIYIYPHFQLDNYVSMGQNTCDISHWKWEKIHDVI